MRAQLFPLIALFICVTLNCFSQNLNGKWKGTISLEGTTGTTVFQFNSDGTGFSTLTTVQKTPAAPFTLTITTIQTTRFTWQKEESTLKLLSDPSKISIKVSGKVSGGTAAARAKAQKEANYYARNYQDQMASEINENFDGITYNIVSLTANKIEVLTEDGNKLQFTKVLTKK